MIAKDAPVVDVRELHRVYHLGHTEIHALQGVTLQVPAGRFIALKGRSGSGKTTLLNCLGGLDHPSSGTVSIFGHNLAGMDDRAMTEFRRRQVGFIFQSFGLIPTLSAYENVELMLRIAGAPGKERERRARYCLELMGLARWEHHRPYELSGGQQQRVAIARALANQPRLILADEPTGELDSVTGREILGLFRKVVNTEGITILMATHDPLVDEFVDEVILLRDGQVFRPGEDPGPNLEKPAGQ